ncbi:MAG: hypothetical protein IJX51_00970 [Clostridia bacterium]|nr:hypothetical protein [Clostridia bacterium]
MTEIITTIGGALTGFIEYLWQAVTSFFTGIFWDGTGETRTISDLGVFLLVLFGIGIAVGCSKLIFNLIKNR